MTYVTRILVLLLVGLFVMSASASADDRLSVSGKIDTRFNFSNNLSLFDRNYTNAPLGSPAVAGQLGDEDTLSAAITRFNLTFTVEALENTKTVLVTHVDKEWGGSGVLFTDGEYAHGAAIGAYGGAMTVEGFWLEGLIPGTAATFQLGVPYPNAEFGGWGESNKIFNTAAPAITVNAPFSDTISTYTWYAWLGQDFDGYYRGHVSSGASKDADGDGVLDNDRKPSGNDWAAGTRWQFTLMEGLAVDLVYAFYFNEAGALDTAATDGDETGNWIQSKLWYQFGDFRLQPSITLYFASHDTAGDTESFLLDLRAGYTVGPLALDGRVVFTPGNSDGKDRSYDVIGVWGIPQQTQWFSLFGNSAHNDLGPLLLGSSVQANIRHETFGLMHAAAKAAYTLTPQTTLSLALGLFNTAEDTSGMPADGDKKGEALYGATYAGGSHLATEVDAELAYQLLSNTTIYLWAAYAMTGDALDLTMGGDTYESQDIVGAGARINYTF